MKAVLGVAKGYGAALGLLAGGVTDKHIEHSVRDTLFEGREGWACAQEGLLTRTEIANLVLARLQTALEHASGVSVVDCGGPEWTARMEQALFGSALCGAPSFFTLSDGSRLKCALPAAHEGAHDWKGRG
jgi:hypothetical protein